MMNERDQILTSLNETIETEHGKPITEENVLSDSEIDSFGYAIFWLSIEEKYGKCFLNDEMRAFNYETLTIKAIIDRIINAQNNIA